MDYLPITYQNRDSGSPHNPMPMRDLLKSLLHEELSNNHVVKQEPLKWTQSFQLHHHFHPGEVKVFIKDGKLRLHAKHARGEDDENCDIRESKRSVTLPADIDRSIACSRSSRFRSSISTSIFTFRHFCTNEVTFFFLRCKPEPLIDCKRFQRF